MAACVARATARVSALICGGFSLFDPLTPASLRQLDRRLRPDHASRSLRWWVARKLRRAQAQLTPADVEFVEFAGLDHAMCNAREALREHVVPTVSGWLAAQAGPDC